MKKSIAVVICICLCFGVFGAVLASCNVVHRHIYSDKWSVSETEHWHDATCGHDVEHGREPHEFVDGVCSVCGYRKGTDADSGSGGTSDTPGMSDIPTTPDPSNPSQPGGSTGPDNPSNPSTPDTPTEPKDPEDTGYDFSDAQTAANQDFYKKYSEQEKQLYYTLWDQTTKVSVAIDISPYELQKINEAYYAWRDGDATKADTYRKCNLTITVNGQSYYYEEVGIRMRGNTSRSEFVDKNGNIFNLVHFRFSLTETFDGDEYENGAWGSDIYHNWHKDTPEGKAARDERKDRSFATMEKFYYKWNKCYDQTYIREIYANRMFRAYGILAPHITLSQFSITQNGAMKSIGVGNLYELIDKQFIKRNFDSDHKGGDLYKCTYSVKGPADLTYIDDKICGIETATEGFSYDLKTNDDPEDFNNHKYIKSFVQMLNAQTNDNQFQTQLESMMDMDYFARFEAVNYLLGNPDCIRNHSNNYYLYFTPEDANGNFKTYIIPYDYDRCLGVNDWNPNGDSMTGALPYSPETTIDENGRNCLNPLYTRTVLYGGIAKYRNMLASALQTVLDGKWFTMQNYTEIYNDYAKSYSNVVRPDFDTWVNEDRLTFSLSGDKNEHGGGNLDVARYMQLKRQIALAGM